MNPALPVLVLLSLAVIVVELGESTVNLRARWWTHSTVADGLNAQDRYNPKIKRSDRFSDPVDLEFDTAEDQTERQYGPGQGVKGDVRRRHLLREIGKLFEVEANSGGAHAVVAGRGADAFPRE